MNRQPGILEQSRISGIVVVLILALATLSAANPLLAALLPIAGAMVLMTLERPEWGLRMLLIASMFSLFSKEVGPVHIRPDQIVTLFLAIICVFLILNNSIQIRLHFFDFLLVSYLVINVFSSYLSSPDLKMSIQRCLLLMITVAAYFVSYFLITSRGILDRMLRLLIILGVLEAVYGILSVVLLSRGIDIQGAYLPFAPIRSDIYARGTLLEGNIFGSSEMMISLIMIPFFFENGHFKKSRILLGILIVVCACIVSFTRAVWVGLLLGLLIYFTFIYRSTFYYIIKNAHVFILIGAFLCVAGYLVTTSIHIGNSELFGLYKERFQSILQSEPGTTGSWRLTTWTEALKLWTLHPFFGWGTDSIKVLGVLTKMAPTLQGYWIPNSMILALHDTGVCGFLIFAAVQISFAWRIWNARSNTSDSYFKTLLGGFFIAFISAQFAYLFTNAFWLIFIWVFMGMGAAAARLASKDSTRRGP